MKTSDIAKLQRLINSVNDCLNQNDKLSDTIRDRASASMPSEQMAEMFLVLRTMAIQLETASAHMGAAYAIAAAK